MDWKNFDKVFDSWDPIWSLWPRTRIDKIFAGLGIAIGSLLTAYAYYANLHERVPDPMLGVYIVFFFPSMALEVTERVGWLAQAIIVTAAVGLNGALYVAVSRALRSNPPERPR
jgi:hypothetical protein